MIKTRYQNQADLHKKQNAELKENGYVNINTHLSAENHIFIESHKETNDFNSMRETLNDLIEKERLHSDLEDCIRNIRVIYDDFYSISSCLFSHDCNEVLITINTRKTMVRMRIIAEINKPEILLFSIEDRDEGLWPYFSKKKVDYFYDKVIAIIKYHLKRAFDKEDIIFPEDLINDFYREFNANDD
ncbi:hypothetical protein [Endozoicomonas acroporae]|uniref:hypothetical protein n=1 Tax=Endozoicomonas acroporae TaxID=1701104 RepID=UPI003D78DAEB